MLRLQSDVDRSNEVLGRNDRMPKLRFDLRGRCAGQAIPGAWAIRLNTSLLSQHGQGFVDETVPHEWAHLLAYAIHGPRIRPHGGEWRDIMELLGCRPDVCHSYAVKPARQVRRHSYRCACQSHELSSIRHRRVQSGQQYLCKSCGSVLVPGDAETAAC